MRMQSSARLVSTGVRRSGSAALIRRLIAKRRVSVLVYHDPDPETIAKHLAYLRPRYSGVTLTQVVDAMRNDEWQTLPDYPLAITFDDGWKGNLESFEHCRRRGFPVTVFACSAIIDTHRHYWWTATEQPESLKPLASAERLAILKKASGFDPEREYPDRQALSRGDLESIQDAVEIGAHTRFHPILPACSDAEAWEEIHLSRLEIEALTGRPCRHFAYPNGDYTDREAGMVQRAGFMSARTIRVGWNTPGTDPYRLRYLGTPDDAGVDRLAADLAGASLIYTPVVKHLRRISRFWRQEVSADDRPKAETPWSRSDSSSA